MNWSYALAQDVHYVAQSGQTPVSGFTVTNGNAPSQYGGIDDRNLVGGGILFCSAGVLTNSPIVTNCAMTIIGQLMGHSTLRTTQRYIANNFEYQQTAMDRLADRFSTLTDDKMAAKVVPAEKAFSTAEVSACVKSCRKTG